MRLLHTAMIGVALTLSSGGAMAMSRGAGVHLPAPDSGFDWNRFYVGTHVTGLVDAAGHAGASLGGDIGVNARIEVVLAGAEISVDGLSASGLGLSVAGTARAGLMLSDSMALYGTGGVATPLMPAGGPQLLAGAGLEAALADSISVDAKYLHGSWPGSSATTERLTIGTNIHF